MPSMKRFKDTILSRTKSSLSADGNNTDTSRDDNPESTVKKAVSDFCKSGSPDGQGEEVLHLPVIVESAESSPAAAAAAANQIRKFFAKNNFDAPHIQYNAIMLMRILAENPGPPFTKNIDTKFVNATANVLRTCRDPSVQHLLRETLDVFETERTHDEGLKKLIEMWRMNKGFNAWFNVPANFSQNGAARSPNPSGRPRLPPPVELASRLEEARNSAKILVQMVQSTPIDELLANDLVKEFTERCQNAQRSLQVFMNSDPPPDPDTLQTLIEVSEQLSLSLSKHQRAMLNARRTLGMPTGSGTNSPALDRSNTGTPVIGLSTDRSPGPDAKQDPFSDNAERSTLSTGPTQLPPTSKFNSAANAMPSNGHGNGEAPADSDTEPLPVVYRY